PSGNLQLSANILVQASCTVGGSATVNVFNGSGNYSYLWSNGQTSQTATNLGVGTHSVTVVDITSGCVASTTVAMTQISAPTVTASITTQATCTTGATATANVSGGLAPYTFIWSNGQTTQTATNLGAGSHSVTVTDAGGCVVISTVTVVAPQGPTVAVQVVSNATCTTGGSATAIATGGAGGYVYLWDNGQTTATATGLVAGNHVVTVTDANGCAAVGLVTIGQSSGPSAAAAAIGAATCTSGGTATVTVTGGTTPYTYLWDNGQTTATATNLAPGQHSVTVTDANGCVAVALVNISSPLLPSVLATATSPATCVTGGTATALGSGGTPPYTYLWDNGQTTQNATNLSAGTHTVTLTDAGGCTATATVSISGTASPTAIITASSNATCSQGGSATVVAAGGIVPYTYLWDNGETTATAINLAAGTHTVTVTDAGGCKAIATVTIGLINNGIKIGDFVWYDNDQNGFQHPLETNGVPNMTVMLMRPGPDGIFGTPDDVTVQTTTTNGQGKYELDCVTPGTYILMFSGLPTGFQFSQKDAGNDDCKDSDVKSNGKTDPFTITAGQANNFCFDAGVHQFCDNVSMAGTIAADQTICEGDTPDPLYSVMPAGGGSGGPIEYMWLQLVTVGPSGQQWVGVPNSNSPGLVLGPLYVTTSFMRCARRAGCVNFLESNIVTITVKPAGSPGCPTFLKNFGVTSASKHTVAVHFVTNPEPMPYLYVVQHSTDQQKWADVATIMGKQDATNPNDYAFMHEQPAAGMNYYRIKRADAGNNQAFSQNAALDMQIPVAESVAIYPNPVGNSLTIRNMVTYESDVNVQISTTSGTLLYTFDIPAGSIRSADFGMSHLPAGIYVARVRFSKKEVQTVKIVKH
ncbi:MAG: SdrD B-like domain-containing protein, partial [Saprospiraceae bacterium]